MKAVKKAKKKKTPDQCCDIMSPWEYVAFSEAEVDISGMIVAGQR